MLTGPGELFFQGVTTAVFPALFCSSAATTGIHTGERGAAVFGTQPRLGIARQQ